MNAVTEPETLSELIADCADIPDALRSDRPPRPRPASRQWQVDDACQAQVAELDAYV